jgi:hypothetical protein
VERSSSTLDSDEDTRPGKRTKSYGKIHHAIFMGKSTISMAIFNSKLLVYQRVEVMLKQPRNWICDDV